MQHSHTTNAFCYHCGLPVAHGSDFSVEILGKQESMCCPGCQAIALAIIEGGLENFYRFRSAKLETAKEREKQNLLKQYDLPEIQEDFVVSTPEGHQSAQFIIKGISCSACAWLIENFLRKQDGVIKVSVNVSQHRCLIEWRQSVAPLSNLLLQLESIGYEVRPANDAQIKQTRDEENKQSLLRLGVAGLGMMQAGMVAIALYAGDAYGIDSQWENLLRWVSFILVTPVVLYSARPFFVAAWRSLKIGHLVMDVPVSIAIGLAYLASTWATLNKTGEVYFDSVSMFTFFLLLGRYLEMRVRHRNNQQASSFNQIVPAVATKISEQTREEESVAVKTLQIANRIRIGVGDTIPCDGIIIGGQTEVNEAILSGEQKPITKTIGLHVSAGSINVSNPIDVEVKTLNKDTRLANILNLADSSYAEKPQQLAIADKLSAWFVAAVLIIAIAAGAYWYSVAPEKALWIVLSILVVTCPCALSLATPAAITVATNVLKQQGFLVKKGHVLEGLATIDHCIFDKTGTLTMGNMCVQKVDCFDEYNEEYVLQLIAGLEKGSNHPIAKAFQKHLPTATKPSFSNVEFFVSQGVCGILDNRKYCFGKPDFVLQTLGLSQLVNMADTILLFANKDKPIALITLVDEIRTGANTTIRELKLQNIGVELLSGDNTEAVKKLAEELSIETYQANASPSDKLARVKQLQLQHKKVLMLGDGINDIPILSAANISVAMGDAADLTQLHADSILLSSNLSTLTTALNVARKCKSIIKQNLTWALLYNLIALPLACMGLVPPWAAAIGMSLSSLIVVVNALRLNRFGLNNQAMEA